MSQKGFCIVDQVARESNKSSLNALCVMYIAISLTYLRLLPLNIEGKALCLLLSCTILLMLL